MRLLTEHPCPSCGGIRLTGYPGNPAQYVDCELLNVKEKAVCNFLYFLTQHVHYAFHFKDTQQ